MKPEGTGNDLLIDLGNSRVKWALFHENGWRVGQPFSRTESIASWIRQFATTESLQRILVSNSAGPEAEGEMEKWCNLYLHRGPIFISAERSRYGVHNLYPEPSTLGPDRWLALIAARHQSSAPAAVIDCGTAVTVDALDGRANFLGGVIIPGAETFCESLLARVEHLHVASTDETTAFNLSTGSALANGAFLAVVGGIDRTLEAFIDRMGKQTRVILTGGNAKRFGPMLRYRCTECRDLVLEGLRVIAGAPE